MGSVWWPPIMNNNTTVHDIDDIDDNVVDIGISGTASDTSSFALLATTTAGAAAAAAATTVVPVPCGRVPQGVVGERRACRCLNIHEVQRA